ncbi:hypothetical protein MY4824_005942 [Beauveria thailandica]
MTADNLIRLLLAKAERTGLTYKNLI